MLNHEFWKRPDSDRVLALARMDLLQLHLENARAAQALGKTLAELQQLEAERDELQRQIDALDETDGNYRTGAHP